MNNNHIVILLGTYNGEPYIEEQIKSIQDQTRQNWTLFIRDDGSTDNTVRILNSYQQEDNRIRVIVDKKSNLGTCGNFNELCKAALKTDVETLLFCDQDDVWLPDKIENQVNAIQRIENQYGKGCPILVHSDLSVVDSHLKRIHKSFLAYHGVRNVEKEALGTLLAQNYITACASAFNRSLLKLATPIPDEVLMHDWWFALCAAACGQIGFIETPMTLYRQHHNNTIGAKGLLNYSINPFQNDLKARWRDGYNNFIRSMHQAALLKERIEERKFPADPGALKCIDIYANCLLMRRGARLKAIWNNQIHRQGIFYQILFYILLLCSSLPVELSKNQY